MFKNKKAFMLILMAFVLVMGLTSFAADTTVIYGPAANEAPFQLASPTSVDPVEYGQKFTFDAGKELTKLTISSMPTWGPREEGVPEDNSVILSVYKWDTDYATTVAGTPIKVVTVTNHVDGQPVDIVFETALVKDTYFWEATEAEAAIGGIGFWGGAFDNENCKAYVNGVENNGFFARTALVLRDANVNTGDSAFFAVFVIMVALAAVVVKKRAFN